MSDRNEEAAYTELTPDSWHQNDEGYYIDCPECGSAATLSNVISHGRCNGYLDQREGETELDEQRMECTARLWFELGYVSDPEGGTGETAGGTGETGDAGDGTHDVEDTASSSGDDVGDADGVPGEGTPPGTDGAVDDDQQ
ncbi:hypothetical protein [Natrarchaeobius chitinivorans]|uniref:Uncharacterized protein n=1 Tax=Natrarchaeobius chitinivorans TaxID=1679083 RepID=A0A3N6LVY1_NATCH|nr:hypothetical protein [Natrarchaeobius chitinivorans]RQG94693.1 hypothetical protein EA473_10985 [Natrarchaeobius chitinivorans]